MVNKLLLYRNESSSVSTGNFILQWSISCSYIGMNPLMFIGMNPTGNFILQWSINYSYIGMNPLMFLLATLFYNGQ